MKHALSRIGVDPFLLGLAAMVGLASLFPARGGAATAVSVASNAGIALLFFLHGAKLALRSVLDGARNWRLQTTVLTSTFVLFPLLGLAGQGLWPGLFPAPLWAGLILVCLLPSTVQSSIAFTSIAGGNVPAALCAASVSNLLGTVLTPALVALLIAGPSGGISSHGTLVIGAQLLLPFAAGQAARPWLSGFLGRYKSIIGLVDRGSILLVVYTAFGEGVREGIWHQISLANLLDLALASALLLAAVMGAMTLAGRLLGLSRADRIALLFCGSKKSLASGLPMASALFAGSAVGLVVLPLMLFHQIQLIVCAMLARRYAAGERTATAVASAAVAV